MTAKPHHVGSPYGKENAEFALDLFKQWGFEARIEDFDVTVTKADRPFGVLLLKAAGTSVRATAATATTNPVDITRCLRRHVRIAFPFRRAAGRPHGTGHAERTKRH